MEVVGQLVCFNPYEAWFYGVEVGVELFLIIAGYKAQVSFEEGVDEWDELFAPSNDVLPESRLGLMNPCGYAGGSRCELQFMVYLKFVESMAALVHEPEH